MILDCCYSGKWIEKLNKLNIDNNTFENSFAICASS